MKTLSIQAVFLLLVSCSGARVPSLASRLPRASASAPSLAGATPARAPSQAKATPVSAAVPPRGQEVRQSQAPSFTGEDQPSIVLKNAFLTAQYVFLDGQPIGEVPQGAERVFLLPSGAHAITFSDNAKGDSNLGTIAEVFDPGFVYRYEVVAR